jgi:HSP20 family protein
MTTLFKTNSGKIKPASISGMFDPFFKKEMGDWFGKEFVDTIPGVNITETNSAYHVELAAPGLKKDDFTIKVDGDIITISSEKETETKKEDKEYSRREYNYSSFSRSFNLPEYVNQDKIMATYVDGVLKVDLPKKEVTENSATKKIKVS